MHVDNVREFVGTMERALVDAIASAGVPAGTRDGREFTGVWVEDRKIGSIGIHVSRRVSMHGFAVNVDNDLAPFSAVVACGLPGVRMTSLREEGSPEGVDCFRKRAATPSRASSAAASGSCTPRRIVRRARRDVLDRGALLRVVATRPGLTRDLGRWRPRSCYARSASTRMPPTWARSALTLRRLLTTDRGVLVRAAAHDIASRS